MSELMDLEVQQGQQKSRNVEDVESPSIRIKPYTDGYNHVHFIWDRSPSELHRFNTCAESPSLKSKLDPLKYSKESNECAIQRRPEMLF